jgi:hypothetical protein
MSFSSSILWYHHSHSQQIQSGRTVPLTCHEGRIKKPTHSLVRSVGIAVKITCVETNYREPYFINNDRKNPNGLH